MPPDQIRTPGFGPDLGDSGVITPADLGNLGGHFGLGSGSGSGLGPEVTLPVNGTKAPRSVNQFKDLASLIGLTDLPVAVEPLKVMRNAAPPGYVLVTRRNRATGEDVTVAVLEPMARKLGLKKTRAKPPISATQWKHMKSANRGKAKAKRIASEAGFVCRPKRGGR